MGSASKRVTRAEERSGGAGVTAWPCVLTALRSAPVPGGVTTAHQVPAVSSVSQSVYSPPTPETPDLLLPTPPQTMLAHKALLGLPPTQPTAKVRPHNLPPTLFQLLYINATTCEKRTAWVDHTCSRKFWLGILRLIH